MNHISEAVEFLYSLRQSGVKLGLENMERLCCEYGFPQRAFPVIHVAGTNGKGSVVAMLESIFREAGLRCGSFTSPHLIRINERMRVNGVPVSDAELLKLVAGLELRMKRLAGMGCEPTFFEATNAMAFDWFRERAVDLALIETGLGGRLDSTNVVDPVVSVITSISWDHQNILGSSLEEISGEKAGIIKPARPVVVGELNAECYSVVERKAAGEGSRVYRSPPWKSLSLDRKSLIREVKGSGRLWKIGLAGKKQAGNASVVYETIRVLRRLGWAVGEDAVIRGLEFVQWPARFQRISRTPEVILDGAHNAPAMEDLCETWIEFQGQLPEVIAFGCLRSKITPEFQRAVWQLTSSCKRIFLVPVRDKCSAQAEDVRKWLSGLPVETLSSAGEIPEAFRKVRRELSMKATANPRSPFLICGSLYLAGEVLSCWGGRESGFQPELNG